MSHYPPIMIVDENDQPVGSASLDEVHHNGLLHRIVVVIVTNDRGEILLQKRSLWVATHPGLWDASAAGHVDEGETYKQAALRELKEELGLAGLELSEIDKYRSHTSYKDRDLNRFKMIYKVEIDKNTAINYDKNELLEVKWFSKDALTSLIQNSADSIVPDFINLANKYFL